MKRTKKKKNLPSTIEETVSNSNFMHEVKPYEGLEISKREKGIDELDDDIQNDDDLNEWVDKIPEPTKKLLEEKFNGKFFAVRSINLSEFE